MCQCHNCTRRQARSNSQLAAKNFRFLRTFDIRREGVEYENDYLILEDGARIEADLNQEACADRFFAQCMSKRMTNGAIIHGALD